MCGVGSSLACNNYEPNYAWMEASGNVCWGMGASSSVPCVNCGQREMYHVYVDPDWDDE